MTDKELIKQEIEKLNKEATLKMQEAQEKNDQAEYIAWEQQKGVAIRLISFINSLPEEHASEDLKKEMSKWRNHYISVLDNNLRIDLRDIEVTANHFAEWQKQQIMKDVVLETKVMMDCDGDGIETPYEEWLTLENTEIPSLPDNLGLKDGDKVKIIIVKEEQ